MAVANLPNSHIANSVRPARSSCGLHEKSWPEPRVRASSEASIFEFIDDGDGADSSGDRSSSEGHGNSRNTDKADNICTGNSHTHIRTDSSDTRNLDIRIQFPLKLARQNAAPAQKRLHTSAIRSRGFFSL